MPDTGYINQIICTIQGEGNCIGYPVILIRFNGCNLNCPMCDSKYTWQKNRNPYSFSDIASQIEAMITKYPNIYNFMITGGEPFYQPKLLKFIIDKYNTSHNIQIETNGFDIANLDIIHSKNIQLIISPKLKSKDYKADITSQQIIDSFEMLCLLLLENDIKHIFKLVYCKATEQKLLTFYQVLMTFKLYKSSNFWIMPLTPSYSTMNFNNKYKQSCFDTINFCKEYGFNYSPRIHVDLFKSDNSENCLTF